MNIEKEINGVIEKKLYDGTIEQIIAEKFEKCISDTAESLFRTHGDIGKLISDKLKEILVPAIERHDFSDYLVKLDSILSEIVNATALQDNKKILENFKELMIEEERKYIKISELFEIYCKYVAEHVETSGLDVVYEDEVHYESVRAVMVFSKDEYNCLTSEHGIIKFTCDEDEDLNCRARMYRFQGIDKKDCWDIRADGEINIKSLRYMNEFLIFINKISRSGCQIEINECELEEYVQPEKEPELTYN